MMNEFDARIENILEVARAATLLPQTTAPVSPSAPTTPSSKSRNIKRALLAKPARKRVKAERQEGMRHPAWMRHAITPPLKTLLATTPLVHCGTTESLCDFYSSFAMTPLEASRTFVAIPASSAVESARLMLAAIKATTHK